MEGKTFKRMRADINSHLSKNKKAHYKKESEENERKLLLHCLAQFDIDLDLPLIKSKAAKTVLYRWIESDFSLVELEYHSRVESANWYSGIERRKEKRGLPKGLQGGNYQQTISHLPASKFYSSREWRHLRYEVLSEKGNSCQCCGATPKDGARIHVDHIKPRSIYPEIALDKDNLQVLCDDCNIGKSNIKEDRWGI